MKNITFFRESERMTPWLLLRFGNKSTWLGVITVQRRYCLIKIKTIKKSMFWYIIKYNYDMALCNGIKDVSCDKQNRSTEGCSKLKRSVDMTSSGKNSLNIRTNASPKWDRTRCPEEPHPLQCYTLLIEMGGPKNGFVDEKICDDGKHL